MRVEPRHTAVQETSLSEPKTEDSEGRLISDHSRWEALRDAAVARIQAANEDGSLWVLEQLGYVLFRWVEWTTEKDVRDAVAAHVSEDEKLLAFLGRFVSESHSHIMGDKVSRVRRKIGKTALQHLLDLDAVTERLKGIASGDGEQASVASDLVALLEAKPEGPWDD